MRLFNAGMVDRFMSTAGIGDDVPLESKIVTRSIQSAQSQVEAQNFEIRKNVLKYDDVLNRQREVIYAERREVLHGADLHEQVRHFLDDVGHGYVTAATSDGLRRRLGPGPALAGPQDALPGRHHASPRSSEEAGGRSGVTQDMLLTELRSDIQHAYDRREESLGEEVDPRARAPGRAVRAGPQVARAPLRDGLPPGGHRPAGRWPSATRWSSTSARASCSSRR